MSKAGDKAISRLIERFFRRRGFRGRTKDRSSMTHIRDVMGAASTTSRNGEVRFGDCGEFILTSEQIRMPSREILRIIPRQCAAQRAIQSSGPHLM